MATKGPNSQTPPVEVDLLYTSHGYKTAIDELKNLANLIERVSEDMKGLTLPKIKGLKGTLAEIKELNHAINLLSKAQPSTMAGRDAVGKAESATISKATIEALGRSNRFQTAIANYERDLLRQKAFLGTLSADEIKQHKKSIENLKAINQGYEEAKKTGALTTEHSKLQKQVNTWLTQDLQKKKKEAADERLAATNLRLEQKKIAVRYAREAAEGTLNKADFKSYLGKADLTQINALQSAMKAQSLRADFVKTPAITAYNTAIEKARLKITTGGQVIDPKTVLESVKGATHKGDTDLIIKNLRAEITRQTQLGAKGDSLRDLYRILSDARSESAKKFAPISPFQEAKKAEEAYAKGLAKLDEGAIKRLKDRLILEEHLQASEIRAHKTNMVRGSEQWKAEKVYQDLLKQRLAEVRKQEAQQRRDTADPNAAKLRQNQKEIRDKNLEATIANRQVSAEKAAAKALYDEEKRLALKRGIFKTEEAIKGLAADQIRFAKDTLNFGIQTGKLKGQERLDAEHFLALLKQREAVERRAFQQNQNIANLAKAGKYQTKGDLAGLDKSELEVARKVIAFRMRNNQLTQDQIVAEQRLLDHAKSRENLLTMEAKRKDEAYQHERRLNQLTHLEGDGGASMAVIQAGFMMRSQVLGALSSIFSGAFDSAIQLDKAFRNLQAISASTNYEMATMKINLINVAQASKFSAAEVGETAVMLAQAGLSIQEIGASMKGIITLAQATGTDLAKSVDVVTSVLSIFNKNATETDNIVNQLTAALNESKLDINKMALGLQYAGNIASDSGVSFEELTAALGATANAGIRSGSTLGTGLRQMFIDLQKPNEKLTKRLETLGVTLDQVNFRSQGLEGVLRNLRNAGFSSADAFETFEVRSAAAFSALSGNLEDFHTLQEELADTNAAFEANNVQMESFAVQLDHLKSNLGVLAAEGLKPTLALMRDVTKGLAHMMENSEEGSGAVRAMTTAFTGLMTAVTITWFTKLVWEIGKLTLGIAGLTAGLSLTGFGLVGLVGGVVTAVAAFSSYTDETERLNTALDKAKGKHNDLKAQLTSVESNIHNVDDSIKDLINRYGVLSKDTKQTELVSKSLMNQFEELGLQIDEVGNKNIDHLISKMQELRAEMSKKLVTQVFETAEAKREVLYTELEKAQANIRGRKGLATEDTVRYILKGLQAEGSALTPYETLAGLPADNPQVNAAKYALKLRELLNREGVSPDIRTNIEEMLQGLALTYKESGSVPVGVFSAAKTKYNLSGGVSQIRNPTTKRQLGDVVKELYDQIKDVERSFSAGKELQKIDTEANLKSFKIQAAEIGNQPDKLVGYSQNLLTQFNKEVSTISDGSESFQVKTKKLADLAKDYLSKANATIAVVEGLRDKAKEQGKADYYIAELERQIGLAKEDTANYRKLLSENDKKLRQQQLQDLKYQLNSENEAVKEAEKLLKLSTGTNLANTRKGTLEKLITARDTTRLRIAELEQMDSPNAEQNVRFLRQQLEIEKRQRDIDFKEFTKGIVQEAAKSAQSSASEEQKAALQSRKDSLDRFFRGLETDSKLLDARQESERFQLAAKQYKPLTTGDMFNQLNRDERAAAQAKANATGVSQEYSQFGKNVNPFARQAARLGTEDLQKRQIQERLALEVTQLYDLQQQKLNYSKEAYTALLDKEIALEEQVKKLRDISANSKLEKDKEVLKLKEDELDMARQASAAAREAQEKFEEEITKKKSTIENLTDNLQALIDKYDLFDTTLTAGVQSMTSGLSSIFSDWASGVIKNTHDVKEAFRSLGQSVLQSMAKVVSDRIAQQFMGFLLNGLGNFFGGSGEVNLGMGAPKQVTVSTGGLITPTGVKHFAGGGFVSGTNIGRDSVPALLQPNEYVVQRSAVQALGTDFMQNLNNVTTGSLRQGAAALGATKPMVQNVMKASPPVNVYVVSPEQQRQMGQEDVVVALQDDILRGGTTKKLIKAVISGEV